MTSLFTKISRMPEEKRQRIKEAIELLEGEPCLVSKSNSNPDDRLGLYAQIEQLTAERDALLADVDRCYKMLLSEPDTQGALFKAENILREVIASAKCGAA